MESHPSWVCGLKQSHEQTSLPRSQSHPSWVCGLKLDPLRRIHQQPMSHPSWVCGLKLPRAIRTPHWTGHTLRGCVD